MKKKTTHDFDLIFWLPWFFKKAVSYNTRDLVRIELKVLDWLIEGKKHKFILYFKMDVDWIKKHREEMDALEAQRSKLSARESINYEKANSF